MSDSILSHVILCECLSFSQEKIRPTNLTEISKFLSSLALILNGTAACTAVYIHKADKIVFIARNEPITATDQRYFDRFFRQIRLYANLYFDKNKSKVLEEVEDQLESLIFEYNSKKIIKRIIGQNAMVIDQLREMVQWNTNEKSRFIEELRSNQELYENRPLKTEKLYLISKHYTEEDYVQFLFEKLGQFLAARDQLIENQMNPTDHQLALVTGLASVLYQSRLFQYILHDSNIADDNGVYHFEKISAHIRSIDLLLKCLHYQKEHVSEIYKNISWKLVPSIVETRSLPVTPRQAFEQIFENLCRSSDEKICNIYKSITAENFYKQHLQRVNKFDTDAIDVHLHAEILLINYLLQNNINETNNSKDVEIGISKMSCLLCSYYIDILNKKYDRCFCQCDSTHGKVYSKWTYRSNEDPSILNLINKKLIGKIQDAIKKLCLESDRARPVKNRDSDIMSTMMEGDEFDAHRYGRICS